MFEEINYIFTIFTIIVNLSIILILTIAMYKIIFSNCYLIICKYILKY